LRARSSPWRTRTIALGVVAMLVASGQQAVAAPAAHRELPALQTEKSVATSPVAPRALPPVDRPVTTAAESSWPTAARAEVALSPGGTTTNAKSAAAPTRVAGTPVSVGITTADAQARQATPAKVEVEVFGQGATRNLGLNGVVFSLSDKGTSAKAPLKVAFDYKSFASAYGGDYGTRLRLVSLPSCALTTPAKAECRTATPVAVTKNDVDVGVVSGETAFADQAPMAFAVTAAAAGSAGSFAATSLAPAGSWSAGGSAGDFSYGYPMRVPPAIGGGAPALSLGYSAQSLDGRTSSSNNQASWAGDGWDLAPGGFIERQYKPCGQDLGGNNGQTKTGDQCWSTDSLSINLVGVSGQLIKDQTTGRWRAKNDDGARIERLTGAQNGDDGGADDKGEYWRVTTTNGTQYFLGRNRLPGWASGKPETQSTWTTPVYGNNDGEPCKAATFDASWCNQAYRWNLDSSVDPHGNVTTYYYQPEFNFYGRNQSASKSTKYVRGGYLTRVEYGLRDSDYYAKPGAKVTFDTAERCLVTQSFSCDPALLNTANAKSWPDVPADQICKEGDQCSNFTPSFFTRKRLTKVTTAVATASDFQPVDSWSLTHEFLNTGDGLAPSLNLMSVVHTGLVGGSITLPATVFSHTAMPNRVDSSSDDKSPITRYRLTSILGEGGGSTTISYSPADCVAGSRMPASPETNTYRCYPTWWAPEGALEPSLDWFHKYVVTLVADDDRTGASSVLRTRYEYLDYDRNPGGAAWHYDENEFGDQNRRTWSQWRGYGVVRTVKGEAGSVQSITESQYLRGMDGDKLPSGTRSVQVPNAEGGPVADVQRLQGFVRETRQYNGSQLVSASLNDPWVSAPTATDATGKQALLSGSKAVRGRTLLEDGTWRRTQVNKQFNTEGIVTRTEDLGDLAVTDDQSCTRTDFARNETTWMLSFASLVQTVKGTCDAVASPATILTSARSYYDNQALGVAPTRGDITKAEALDKWDGAGQKWVTASTSVYDAVGRPLEVVDATGQKTTTTYTPAFGPLTGLSSKNPLGHETKGELNPAWGATLKSIDANNRVGELRYDALGRVVEAWSPGHDRNAVGVKADATFEYQYYSDKPNVVVSKQLQDNNNTYLTAYTLYDGLMRERQTQAPAPNGGRQISDTFYDSRGLVAKQNAVYWNDQAPNGVLSGALDVSVPNQTITTFDHLERPTAAIYRKFNVEQWRTSTGYGGDRVHSTPPPGSPATTLINDAHGRTLEKRQYTAGLGSSFDTTKYAYNAAGLLSSVTDPVGNTWTYQYDLRGRAISSDDPDAGHSTKAYNDAGQLLSSTDGRGKTIAYAYDVLGRKKATYENSTAGTKLAEWEYDTTPGGIGLPKLSRRLVDGHAYEQEVVEYGKTGLPTTLRVTIPDNEGALGSVYELDTAYTLSGKVQMVNYIDAESGGRTTISGESVRTTYNSLGLPETTVGGAVGSGNYVSSTNYSSYGEVLRETYDTETRPNLWVSYEYEEGTRRLARNIVERETQTGNIVADRKYGYDESGNILKIADTPQGGASDVQCFGYDYLRRMNEAWTPSSGDCGQAKSATALGGPAPYWHSWTFDKTGNRTTETQHASAGNTVRETTFPAAGAAQPHTARSVKTTSPTGIAQDTFAYNEVGATTSRTIAGNTQTLEYDVEGNVSKVTNADGKVSRYLYDADGKRLITREPSADTLYVFGQEIRLEKNTTTPTWTRYYSHNGHVVAMRNSVTGIKWLLADHQGTNQIMVSGDALTVTQRRQLPYGGSRGAAVGAWADRHGFVGGTNDESGLTNLGARLYDSASGRFLSADPIVDNNDPQQMNGYAYANNSPVSDSDPSGLKNCGPDGVLCGYNPAVNTNRVTYEKERTVFLAIERSAQVQQRQQSDASQRYLKSSMTAAGISEADYAKALADAAKTKWDVIKEVAWEVIKDLSGWNDIVDCFTKGDILACGGLILNLVPISKVGKILEAGYKAVQAVKAFDKAITKARALLGKVSLLKQEAEKVVTETAQGVGGGCPTNHSFVASTRVLMADGSAKPIVEVDIGDRVTSTDPDSGETSIQEVVATIVHSDEGDMTRLSVVAADGLTTGSVDATSWHPVWVVAEKQFVKIGELQVGQQLASADGARPVVSAIQRYARVEPVYDLTISGVHTYHVVAGSSAVLVHNCGFFKGWGKKKDAPAPIEANATVRDLQGIDLQDYVKGGQKDRMTKSRSDEELLNSVFNPHDGMHMAVYPSGGMLNGNHRAADLLRRAADPSSSISWTTPIYVKNLNR
jgi:RHS repeat-associated protein